MERENYVIHIEVTPLSDGQIEAKIQAPEDPLLTIDILTAIIKQQLGLATNQRSNMQSLIDTPASEIEIAGPNFLKTIEGSGV